MGVFIIEGTSVLFSTGSCHGFEVMVDWKGAAEEGRVFSLLSYDDLFVKNLPPDIREFSF